MQSFWQGVISAWQAQSSLEMVAVALGLAYLVLAMKQSQWCWYAAFGSTAIFSWLFFDVSLVMESALNVYYLLMAIYGWWCWRSGNKHNDNSQPELLIQRWRWQQHALALGLIVGLALVSGYLLSRYTDAALPYLDSFTTWGSVVTTYMVARKVLENWLYWQIFNTGAILLYLDRELYLVALLMMIYLALAVLGWFMWLRDYRHQQMTR